MKKKGICGICPHKCPVLVTIEKERIVKAEADVEHPEGRSVREVLWHLILFIQKLELQNH